MCPRPGKLQSLTAALAISALAGCDILPPHPPAAQPGYGQASQNGYAYPGHAAGTYYPPSRGYAYSPGYSAPSTGYPSSWGYTYAPAPAYAAANPPPPALPVSVVLYTTTWCDNCRILETKLSARGIPYQLVDVEQNRDAWDRARTAAGGGQRIPLTGVRHVSYDTWVEGDDADRIERAYRGL